MIKHSNGASRQVISHKSTQSSDHVRPEAGDGFVITPQLEELIERAKAYLESGYPINFSGPAGTGKTTLALHVAANSGRPVMLIHGDDEFGSSDLVGSDVGYRKNRMVDQYVHSVVKEEETMRTLWIDNRLTTACRYGHTLVYDEFTRSRPEANNVLLSVLGEEILNLTKLRYAGEG
jgi:gas vesicle protein GvpN